MISNTFKFKLPAPVIFMFAMTNDKMLDSQTWKSNFSTLTSKNSSRSWTHKLQPKHYAHWILRKRKNSRKELLNWQKTGSILLIKNHMYDIF